MATVTLGASGTYTTGAALASYMAGLSLTEDLTVQVSDPTADTTDVSFSVSALNGFKVYFVAASGYELASPLRYDSSKARLQSNAAFPASGYNYTFGSGVYLVGIQVVVNNANAYSSRVLQQADRCLFYSAHASHDGRVLNQQGSGLSPKLQNCVMLKVGGSIGHITVANATTLHRCTIVGNLRLENYEGPIIKGTYAGTWTFVSGAFAGTGSGYNATTEASISDTVAAANSVANVVPASAFVSVTSGSEDFSLPSGSVLRNAGTAISGLTTDFYGASASQGAAPDIGAVEYAEASGPVLTGPNYYYGMISGE